MWALGVCLMACSSTNPSSHAPDGAPADAALPEVSPVALPDGPPGIGFDDLRYAPVLGKVLVPAGRTGNLDLVDPKTLAVVTVSGFSASSTFTPGAHDSGTTSADEGGAALFAIDHETNTVRVVDPATHAIVETTKLTGSPDYVRYVAATGEIWITEPGTGIEVLTVPSSGAPAFAATIAITGGPEAIAVDGARHRVYTNSFAGQTYAVDVGTRKVVETWTNGCPLSLGLALDEARGFLFVACATGEIVALDAAHGGSRLGSVTHGTSLDIIAFSPALHHLYVPDGAAGDLGILAIAADGSPSVLGAVSTAKDSKGVAADDSGAAWVTDPSGGRILRVEDRFAATP
jgi:hypothetical protein